MRRTKDEILSEIFARSERRIAKNRRRNKTVGSAVSLCCFALIAGLLIGHGIPGGSVRTPTDSALTTLSSVSSPISADNPPKTNDFPSDFPDLVVERIDVDLFLSANIGQIVYGDEDSDPLIYTDEGVPDRNSNVIVNSGKGLTGGSLYIQEGLIHSMDQNADQSVFFACAVFAIVDSNLVENYSYQGKNVARWREEMESMDADAVNPYEMDLEEMESRRDRISAATAQNHLLSAEQIAPYYSVFKYLMGGRTEPFEDGITLYDAFYLYSNLLKDYCVTYSKSDIYLNFCALIAEEYVKADGHSGDDGWSDEVAKHSDLFDKWLNFEQSRESAAVYEDAVSAYRAALNYAKEQYLMDWLNARGIPCSSYHTTAKASELSTAYPYEGVFCIAYPTLDQLRDLTESPGLVMTLYQAN
ncbi:MAG: hypothetical protein ACI3XR_03615 [Eubacteriales bacterium]